MRRGEIQGQALGMAGGETEGVWGKRTMRNEVSRKRNPISCSSPQGWGHNRRMSVFYNTTDGLQDCYNRFSGPRNRPNMYTGKNRETVPDQEDLIPLQTDHCRSRPLHNEQRVDRPKSYWKGCPPLNTK